MLVDLHNSFSEPTVKKATRVIIYDNFNNPLAVFIENDEKTITCITAGDSDFNSVLEEHGIRVPAVKKLT